MDHFINGLPFEKWNSDDVYTFTETLSSDGPLLALGFYELEEWGVWSRTETPILVLPFFVSGVIELKITAMGYGLNINREITISIGDSSSKVMLSPNLCETTIVLDIPSPARKVEFGNILARTIDGINDPRTMGIGISQFSIKGLSQERKSWDGESIFIDLANDDEDQLKFIGFHEQEAWGIWSKLQECHVLLPSFITGACEIQIFAQGFGKNNGRNISISIGDSFAQFVPQEEPQQFIFRFNTTQSSILLTIHGLAPESTPTDPRTLGIAIHRLQVTLPSEVEHSATEKVNTPPINLQKGVSRQIRQETYSLRKHSEVYSALFGKDSKNNEWRDVVSAFVWNFREDNKAVLIIKNSSASAASFFSELMFLFYRIGEMKCRVIAIHSHDIHSDVDNVIFLSHVYVHTDASISAECALDKINELGKISIVSSSEEELIGKATIGTKPNRHPKRIQGSLFGVERELEYLIDWNQLVNALQTAHKLMIDRRK